MFSMILVNDYLYGGLMDTQLAVIHVSRLLKELQSSESRAISLKDSNATKYCKGHQGYIFSVCGSIKSKYIYTGSGDCSVRIWNIEQSNVGNPVCVCVLSDNDDSVTAIVEVDYEIELSGSVTNELYFFISGTKSGNIKLWRFTTSDNSCYCMRTLSLGAEILTLFMKQSQVFCSSRDERVRVFDKSTLAILYDLRLHEGAVMVSCSRRTILCLMIPSASAPHLQIYFQEQPTK
jgi:WD40 repeat protein